MLDKRVSGWLSLDKEVKEGTTISDLLMDLVNNYPDFQQVVFNPETGLVTEQINVSLNDNLLTFHEISQIKLSSGDIIVLLPIYAGG